MKKLYNTTITTNKNILYLEIWVITLHKHSFNSLIIQQTYFKNDFKFVFTKFNTVRTS